MQRKGWFKIPGVQDGDRTLAEQMLGVAPALAEAAGKRVLDLGCAEGLIGLAFVQHGAASVMGYDSVGQHLSVAQDLCKDLPMRFRQADLQTFAAADTVRAFDIVLCLGVAHKMRHPGELVRYAARACWGLVLVRMCARGEAKDGVLRSKHFSMNTCNVHEIMAEEGFRLEQVLPGPREETVHWWRREA